MQQIEQTKQNKVPRIKELNPITYKLIGICFEIHNRLGSSYKEVYYQRAFEKELQGQGLDFQREKEVEIMFKDTFIGKHYIDFIIMYMIILEFKTVPFLKDSDTHQLLSYLKSMRKRLGLPINFRSPRLQVKHVILPKSFLVTFPKKVNLIDLLYLLNQFPTQLHLAISAYACELSLIVRSSVSKSTEIRPNFASYPSLHSKLSRSAQ